MSDPQITGKRALKRLTTAASRGDLEGARQSLGKLDSSTLALSGRNAVMMAAANGHRACVELLAADNPGSIHMRDGRGRTALLLAVNAGHIGCVQALAPISDHSAVDHEGMDALMLAVQWVEGLQALLPHGDAKRTDPWGNTALHHACRNSAASSLKLLIPASDPRARNHDGETPLMVAANGRDHANGFADSTACVAALLHHGGALEVDNGGRCALHRAAGRGNEEAVDILMPHSNVFAVAKDGLGAESLARRYRRESTASLIAGFARAQLESRAIAEAAKAGKAQGKARSL